VRLVASLPCYLESNVDTQRGRGVYRESVDAVQMLNEIGYGVEPGLTLDLVYNPGGATLPPPQAALEADYKRELAARFGIRFNRLLTITNMPIGRFLHDLARDGKADAYRERLEANFNPATLPGLMCRHQLHVGWDGTLYDCDFNYAVALPVSDPGCRTSATSTRSGSSPGPLRPAPTASPARPVPARRAAGPSPDATAPRPDRAPTHMADLTSLLADDPHDERLRANVRPPGWTNPAPASRTTSSSSAAARPGWCRPAWRGCSARESRSSNARSPAATAL
jgi:hypothetical protein